jgi:hypothetical protein
MKRSDVEPIVAEHLPRLSAALGLHHWEVTLSYENVDVDDEGYWKRGECTRLVDYQSAHITLNPSAFLTPDDVLKTLRHELFHIILSPFDLYQAAVDRAGINQPITDLLGRIWDHAVERSVAALERMHEGLTQ